MLEELEIQSLGPIHQAVLRPQPGMTAITGETGAGKSMLLSAIQLLSGSDAQSQRVAPGADHAWVQGIFDVAGEEDVQSLVARAGSPCDEGELFVSRTVPAQGRSRCYTNGKTVPRSLLEQLSSFTVTIHGQAEQLKLASSAHQRAFLDRCCGDDQELADYQTAYQAVRKADEKLEHLVQEQSQIQAQADYLRESIDRIDKIGPQRGEDDALREQRTRIESAADISQAVQRALMALDSSQEGGDQASAADLLEQAVRVLESSAARDLFVNQISDLNSALESVQEIILSLSSQVADEGSPEELDGINGRIHDLEELTRRWGPKIDDVLAWKQQAEFDLEDLDASPEHIDELRKQRKDLVVDAVKKAKSLSSRRSQAAAVLSDRVNQELASLAMAGSRLDILVEHVDELNPWGSDRISFLFTPFPGSPRLPMGKSASGGELSRLMLALELVAFEMNRPNQGVGKREGQASYRPTLIFDEIDAGVGGKSAVELGKRLALLSQDAQVIVVTHLAQVASWADRQYVVVKQGGLAFDSENTDTVETVVKPVEGEARVEEIARMLSGTATETSLDHARELLDSSRVNAQTDRGGRKSASNRK